MTQIRLALWSLMSDTTPVEILNQVQTLIESSVKK